MNQLKIAALCALSCIPAMAQFTYPGCSDLVSTDFQSADLFNKTGSPAPLGGAAAVKSSIVEPVQFDIQGVMIGDSVAYTNIYYVERKGKVRFYDGLAKRLDSIGFIPNWANISNNNANDNGLMGIVLDPNFNTNKWIYFWYTPPIPGAASNNSTTNRRLRLSRITVNAQNRLDMASEKILFDLLGSKTDMYHCGGPMTFDRNGDLWVTLGNNSNDLNGAGSQFSTTDSNNSGEWGSSNTASLRGGIFRIHPDDAATTTRTNRSGTYGPGYTVPSGNFGEYWAGQFESQGNTTLAAQYRDPAKVLPEIYVKGSRSNYSIAAHPTKNWIAWSEVNYNTTSDEFNLVNHPIFAGMPYFHANNQPTPAGSFTLPVGHSAATPLNTSPLNSGVVNLPPATGSLLWWGSTATMTTVPLNCAITGPIYAYDRNLKSSVKFPPHLHNSWIFMNTYTVPSNGAIYIGKLDSINPVLTSAPQLQGTAGFIRVNWRNPIQAKYGPDGALYILYYGSTGSYGSGNNPGMVRVTYTGNCVLAPSSIAERRLNSNLKVSMSAQGIVVREIGSHEFSLCDIAGKILIKKTGSQGSTYSYAKLREQLRLNKGLYIVRVKTANGDFVRNISLL